MVLRYYNNVTNMTTENVGDWKPGSTLLFDGKRFLASHWFCARHYKKHPKTISNRAVEEVLPDGCRKTVATFTGWRKGWQLRALSAAGYTEEQILAIRITIRLGGGQQWNGSR